LRVFLHLFSRLTAHLCIIMCTAGHGGTHL
jgi:hypothetical protein